jgi:hypothetical protein
MLKALLLVFIYPLSLLLSTSKQVYINDSDVILWQENRLLTWDDFKGKPAKRFAAASTNYDILKSIDFKDNTTALIDIKAVFYCKKSWKKEQWIDATVLIHEQKHFDIVELYARKMRKTIKENNYSRLNIKEKTDSLYAIVDKEMDLYQDLYDDETNGSMNSTKQKEWNQKVINEINEFNEFKNTSITITLKN